MLTLTLREGESLVLLTEGLEKIKIQLPQITGEHHAEISVVAPDSVWIFREDIFNDPSKRMELIGSSVDSDLAALSEHLELHEHPDNS